MVPSKLFALSIFFFFFSFCLSNSDIDALLSFKANLSDPTDSLSSWVYSGDPCSDIWFGVTCSPATRRVFKLVLENLNLTGSAEPLSRLSQLRLLSLKNNRLYSPDFNLSSWSNIKHLYLSHNEFGGVIPADLFNLRRLRRLDLSYNYFSGQIPMIEFSRLPKLFTLRLEANAFSGTLESIDSSSLSILDFNVSNNKLSGEIPAWLSRFPVSSYAENENLCGRPLPYVCSHRTEEEPKPARPKHKRSMNRVMLAIIILDVLAIVTAAVIVTCCCCKRRRSGPGGGAHHGEVGKIGGAHYGRARKSGFGEEMVVLEGCGKGFRSVDDLLKSSALLLGKGSVGTTYKVSREGGDVAVVKRVRNTKRRKEVETWLNVIGRLRHGNIVSLRAYCNASNELLLVYDFLPNGSLQSLLHEDRWPGRTPLDWKTRLKHAADSAKGLAFLHGYNHHNKAKLFHGNLTPSNILIDQNGNACLSDIGLRQLLQTPYYMNSPYKAPEVKLNGSHFTQKCDVYSFGVVLLEILTGKMAKGVGETSLVNWVQRLRPEEWSWELFDFELVRDKEMEEEMRALLQVALLCLAPLPKDRPKMNMVHRMIEDIRTNGSVDGVVGITWEEKKKRWKVEAGTVFCLLKLQISNSMLKILMEEGKTGF